MYTWCPGRGATACAASSGPARSTPTTPRRRPTRSGSGTRSPQAPDRAAGCATVTPVCPLTADVLDLSWSRLFQNGQAKGSDSAHKGRFHVLTRRYLSAAVALPADRPGLLRARDRVPYLRPAGVTGLPRARCERGLRHRRLGHLDARVLPVPHRYLPLPRAHPVRHLHRLAGALHGGARLLRLRRALVRGWLEPAEAG